MDKWESHRVLCLVLLVGAISAIIIGISTMGLTLGLPVLMAMIFVMGLTTNCSHTAWYPLGTSFYPTEMRATGTGWLTSVGRLGGITGASMGAVLLSFNLTLGEIFWFLCIPITVGIIASYTKGYLTKNQVNNPSPAVSAVAH
jgi:AAHS family 4-hydroxybenzoate transporter-like MFS transporter